MTKEEIKRTATEYMQIWNSGNENQLDYLAGENLIVEYTHFERPYKGISGYKQMLRMTYNFFPDLKIEINRIIADEKDGIVIVFWEYNGTHKNGNLFGVESSGKKVTVNGISILTVENGLVVKESGIVDNLSLLMQLGVINNEK